MHTVRGALGKQSLQYIASNHAKSQEKAVWQYFSKFQRHLTFNPVIRVLELIVLEIPAHIQNDNFTKLLHAPLFLTAKDQKLIIYYRLVK